MATKKREQTQTAEVKRTQGPESFEEALQIFNEATEHLHKQDFDKARTVFRRFETECQEETEMVSRARTFAKICDQKLAATEPAPESLDECYYGAVLLANDNRAEEAVALLDRALVQDPSSVKVLYARACAWALQGRAERAVSDLRSAISIDPTVRFQATNDPDFERIREEPAFIDVIEPTPAGA